MTTFSRDPFRSLAVLAAATATLFAFLPGLARADESSLPTTPLKFELPNPFAAPAKQHVKHVKKPAPVEAQKPAQKVTTVAPAPAAEAKASETGASGEAPAVDGSAPKISAGPPLLPPLAPIVSTPVTHEDIKNVEAAGDDAGAPEALLTTVTGATTAGVAVVKSQTGGGWHLPLALFAIVIVAIGTFRYLAVKVYRWLRPAWAFFWGWVKWGAAALWTLVKKGLAWLWGLVKTGAQKVRARFQAWRAKSTTTAAKSVTP
ncbi:hypothetical protein [Hyphomicrobium sp.]|uniref:hypothetical protein n=1 Tax=Hyphomicrobium sp. TaxID=82 RepID=UPI001D642B51|nr:hypothetical protein [Hyphomicrobium sp.]MBY0562462.1 hypothetical protein [Hyphomicrobium sp.]